MPKLSLLEKYKEYGVIFIRLIVGFHLIYGTQDNIFSYARMEEFAGFLAVRAVPFPSGHVPGVDDARCRLFSLIAWSRKAFR
jgi:hypothetical protein